MEGKFKGRDHNKDNFDTILSQFRIYFPLKTGVRLCFVNLCFVQGDLMIERGRRGGLQSNDGGML